MAEDRPEIPREVRRALLVEAGHRCAIPACRAHPVVIDHIDDWARVREHKFENLIVLCSNCHSRKGEGRGQIDRKSLRQYKANLGMLNLLYSDLELRILESYIEAPEHNRSFELHDSLKLLVMRLERDGFIKGLGVVRPDEKPGIHPVLRQMEGPFAPRRSPGLTVRVWTLTDEGCEFARRWKDGQPLIEPRGSAGAGPDPSIR